ncbi:hypothetical protein Clacol_005423 [Clathrus columnatus]|uniref:Glutamyl-tRNA(Gln) amidotransferase subunit A, mitochondrial n=1 Tax=Clathrus columnatus TaxID=1419009 RepID=A0AAV5A989_9AGAM|nr:hypothetical protein Clacol_005423 [Clathrus columnatus]
MWIKNAQDPGYDATVVNLLLENGAQILGKTNCDEFGMGSLSIHSFFKPVINPFTPANVPPAKKSEPRSAGGSSGGSAAIATHKLCFAALATDTGGSTRLPAAYCGVAGLKPSYGLISRWGVIAFADSLDTVGIIASKVENIRRVYVILIPVESDVVAQYDERDPTSVPVDIRNAAHDACEHFPVLEDINDLGKLRIGIPQEYFPAELGDTVLKPFRRVLQALEQRGASLIPVSLPSTKYALSAYYVLASAEASSNMARYDGVRYGMQYRPPYDADLSKTSDVYAHTRSFYFGKEVKKRILLGTYALTAESVHNVSVMEHIPNQPIFRAFDNYYLKAQELRKLIRQDFNNVFRIPNVLQSSNTSKTTTTQGVDILLHPTTIRTAPLLSEISDKGLDTYVQDVLTVPASLAGIPAISIPSIADDGWPVGTSIVGQWGSDEKVLKVAELMEKLMHETDSKTLT